MGSPKGGPLEGMSPGVFPNFRRTHKYRDISLHINSPFMKTWEHIKIGGSFPWHNALGFFSWGDPSKYIEM
jgi:hypothetical protein